MCPDNEKLATLCMPSEFPANDGFVIAAEHFPHFGNTVAAVVRITLLAILIILQL